ncbi:UNVERIFIED_CONTAM: hypothetical protein FKN15_074138 [Acipenser sinensis]
MPRVRQKRLERATETSSSSSVARQSAALGSPEPLLIRLSQSPSQGIPCAQALVATPHSCSPSPQDEMGSYLKLPLPVSTGIRGYFGVVPENVESDGRSRISHRDGFNSHVPAASVAQCISLTSQVRQTPSADSVSHVLSSPVLVEDDLSPAQRCANGSSVKPLKKSSRSTKGLDNVDSGDFFDLIKETRTIGSSGIESSVNTYQ